MRKLRGYFGGILDAQDPRVGVEGQSCEPGQTYPIEDEVGGPIEPDPDTIAAIISNAQQYGRCLVFHPGTCQSAAGPERL